MTVVIYSTEKSTYMTPVNDYKPSKTHLQTWQVDCPDDFVIEKKQKLNRIIRTTKGVEEFLKDELQKIVDKTK